MITTNVTSINLNLYGCYVPQYEDESFLTIFSLWTQQIEVRLVAIKSTYFSLEAYTPFQFSRTFPLNPTTKMLPDQPCKPETSLAESLIKLHHFDIIWHNFFSRRFFNSFLHFFTFFFVCLRSNIICTT